MVWLQARPTQQIWGYLEGPVCLCCSDFSCFAKIAVVGGDDGSQVISDQEGLG